MSLDAGALVKQSMGNNATTPTQKKYANINTSDNITGNGMLQNGPFSLTNQNNFVSGNNTKFLSNESEINC